MTNIWFTPGGQPTLAGCFFTDVTYFQDVTVALLFHIYCFRMVIAPPGLLIFPLLFLYRSNRRREAVPYSSNVEIYKKPFNA